MSDVPSDSPCLPLSGETQEKYRNLTQQVMGDALSPATAWAILWRSLDRKGMGIVRAYRNKLRAEEDLALLRQTLDAERSYEMEEYSLYE